MKFLRVLFWEFVQNLPLITGFIIALGLWQQNKRGLAIACITAGSIVGSFIIRFTEWRIVDGHHEPIRIVVVNTATMAGLMLVFVLYLAASWSSCKTDVLAGALAGVVLAIAQGVAAREPIGIRHCAALACAFSLALVGTREIVFYWPVWANILTITTFVTLVITWIDYGSWL